VALLVVLVAVVAVVLLVMRAAAAPGGGSGRRAGATGPRPQRPARAPRPQARTVGPDDDPEFLRELERRARRDDTSA
jgi:hypothetical protein